MNTNIKKGEVIIMKHVDFIKENYENYAVELEDKFRSVNVILNDLLKDLMNEAQSLQKNRNYNDAIKIVEIQKEVNEALKSNRKLIESFQIKGKTSSKQSRKNRTIDKDRERNLERLRKYDEYAVDNTIPHDLKEDYRFKRPFAFQLKDHYQKAFTWKEVLIKTCEYLNKLDPKLFESFASDDSMQWGKTFNFSKDKTLLRNPQLIEGSDVYVKTTKDANAVRQLIIKMLNKYGFEMSDYKIYLRADYTEKQKAK